MSMKKLAEAVLDNTKQINELMMTINVQIPETISGVVDGADATLRMIKMLNEDIEKQQKINRKIGLVLNNICIQHGADNVVMGHLKELVELVK